MTIEIDKNRFVEVGMLLLKVKREGLLKYIATRPAKRIDHLNMDYSVSDDFIHPDNMKFFFVTLPVLTALLDGDEVEAYKQIEFMVENNILTKEEGGYSLTKNGCDIVELACSYMADVKNAFIMNNR